MPLRGLAQNRLCAFFKRQLGRVLSGRFHILGRWTLQLGLITAYSRFLIALQIRQAKAMPMTVIASSMASR